MTPTEAANILRRHNAWRRGDDYMVTEAPDSRQQVDEAMDVAADAIDCADTWFREFRQRISAKDRRIEELETALRQIVEWPGDWVDAVAGDPNPREIADVALGGDEPAKEGEW